MNQALQRRHEQIERWKQNEASIDLSSSKESDNSKDRKSRIFSNKDQNSSSMRRKAVSNVKFSNSTLFLVACANGDFEECERLLKKELVDINTTTTDGLTGLHEAAIAGNRKMVEYLLKNGAQVDCADNEGWTPLHAAASLGHNEVVAVLLLENANPTLVNCENVLAYDLARNDLVRSLIGSELRNENLELLRLQEKRLIEQDISRWLKTGIYDERSHPITNANVLHVLASKGHIELMSKLLESDILRRQINIDAQDTEGFTPLIAAAYWGHTEIVQLLIEHGANALVQSNQGYRFDDFLDSSFAALMKDLFYTRQLERKHDLGKATSRSTIINNSNALSEADTNNSIIENSMSTGLSQSKFGPINNQDNDVTITLKKPLVPQHSLSTIKTSMISPPSSPTTATGDISVRQLQNDSIQSSPGSKSPANESETQRRANAKRVRETRRSTQGISAADVLKAKANSDYFNQTKPSASFDILDAQHDSYKKPIGATSRGANDSVNNQQSASAVNSRSSSVLSLDPSSHHDGRNSINGDENLDINNGILHKHQSKSDSRNRLHPDINNHCLLQDNILDSSKTIFSRSTSLESSLSLADSLNQNELRRTYKELLIENEKLTKQLKEYEDMDKRRNLDWSREKRQMQRKISELEEENKQLEQWKHESQRLKDENSSLLRVISKISK